MPGASMSMPRVDGRPYERQQVQGRTLNNRTIAMLTEAEARLGYSLTLLQGSYSDAVQQSGGTHSGGGAVDLAPYDWESKVRVLRRIGFAAWHRPFNWDGHNGGEHIHAIANGDREMSIAAAGQIADYNSHRDGLADGAHDTQTPHPDPLPLFDYQAFRTEQRQAELRAERRKAVLKHAIASLIRLRRLTDDKATKRRIRQTIETLRSH